MQRDDQTKNKGVIFENCAPFTDCISEMNNTEIDNAKYIDAVMPIYNLIGYSDNYSKNQEICGNIGQINQMILKFNLNHLNTRLT